jgi:hypothetical protein
MGTAPASGWSAEVDEIMGGDQAVALATVTPAKGVVLSPVTNFGTRDGDPGTTRLNTSVGMWKKLERIQKNPSVAVAFHTRAHGSSARPEYVLVQGKASLSPLESRDWLDRHLDEWERALGRWQVDVGRVWERWLRIYLWRVAIKVAAERIVVWPDLACRGPSEVHGAPVPESPPAPQRPPKGGTGPRVNHTRAMKRARKLPHVLLGWVGADRLPVAVPVEVVGSEERGIVLDAAPGLVPAGGRRAGLTAHSFGRHVRAQNQRIHTGWLEAEPGGQIIYAPHTEIGYWIPDSNVAYKLVAGAGTRRGFWRGRRAGFLRDV